MNMALLSLAGALIVTAFAQVAFKKYSRDSRRGYLLLAMALFVAAPPLTYLAVKAYGLGPVYVSTGITYILVALAGWRFFGEVPTRRRGLAMGLVLSGVILFAIGL